MFGATGAAAVNYLVYKNGIAAFEKSEKLVRGMPGSCASFNGAFGMIPNKMLVTPRQCFFLEVGMTAALAFTIFALTDADKTVPEGAQPALIGATVVALAMQYAPVTGCGMNPARDLGPRIVTYAAGWGTASLSYAWWTYTLGPMAGAVLGGALYNATLAKKKQ